LNVVVFTACGTPKLVIQQPAKQSTAPCSGTPPNCSVNVVAQWTGAIVAAPTLTLDGISVTNALNIQGIGTISTAPGTHTINVYGSIVINNGATTVSDTTTFTVSPPPTVLTLSPSSGLTLQAGTSGSLTLSTNNPLSSPLTVTVKSSNGSFAKLGTGSTAAVSNTVTIPASNTSTPATASDAVSAIAVGTATITAAATGATSASATVKVTASAPPPPKASVFRGSSSDAQSFAFSTANTWSAVDTKPSTLSPGVFAVSVALNTTGQLFRSNSSGLDTIVVNADTTFGSLTPISAPLSSRGVSLAAAGTTVVRASDSGIQTFTLSGGTLTQVGAASGGSTATGTGVDFVGTRAVRVTGTGIEVYNIATLSSPASAGSNNTGRSSATAPAVKIFSSGTRAVRATDGGIEIYDITTSNVPLLVSASGGLSSSGSAIALDSTASMAVRAYSGGIEVYSISPTTAALSAKFTNGGLSATGVGVCVKGTDAFRTTDSAVEAYDLSTPGTIKQGNTIPATLSPTGASLTCR
jgi:hypothetical protein